LRIVLKIDKEELKSWIFWIAFAIVFSFTFNHALGYALKTETPLVAVMSNSMYPAIHKGDVLIVKGVDPQDIKIGDIIVYKAPSGMRIVHRVINITNEGYFITRGDNNPAADQDVGISPPVNPNMVLGRVVFRIPYIGWVKVIFSEIITFLLRK